MKNKALIYCRVSTEEQAGEGRYSPETQERLCRRFIEESKNWQLAENGVYRDLGKTATNTNRSGLQDMLIRVQEDKSIGLVVVQDTDRLARNANDHLTIKALLKKHGVTLTSVSQPGLEDTPEGNFMDLVIAGVNQLQSQITSRKTIKSMDERFRSGWWPTRAPIGYLNVGHKDNEDIRIIIKDPIKAPLIKEVFEMYSVGIYSLYEIKEALYKKGLTSLTGGKLAHGQISDILQNHFYYGDMHWRDLVVKGKHEPIVTKALFDQCHRIRINRNHGVTRDYKHNFLLNGYIFSGENGLRYFGEYHPKKDKSYYRCHPREERKRLASDRPIRGDKLEQLVTDKFKGIQFSEDFIIKVIDRVQILYRQEKKKTSETILNLEKQKGLMTSKLEIAEEKLLSRVLADTEFTKIKIRLRDKISSLEDEISKVSNIKDIKVDVIQNILGLIRNVGTAYEQAPIPLKRIYLSLFWQRFGMANQTITKAVPSKIILALIELGKVQLDKRYGSIPETKMFSQKSPLFREGIEITNLRGA